MEVTKLKRHPAQSKNNEDHNYINHKGLGTIIYISVTILSVAFRLERTPTK